MFKADALKIRVDNIIKLDDEVKQHAEMDDLLRDIVGAYAPHFVRAEVQRFERERHKDWSSVNGNVSG